MTDGEDRAERAHDPLVAGRSAVLVVRCWLEPRRGGEPALRGYLRDLRSGEETPIAKLAAVEAHLRTRLGLGASVGQGASPVVEDADEMRHTLLIDTVQVGVPEGSSSSRGGKHRRGQAKAEQGVLR